MTTCKPQTVRIPSGLPADTAYAIAALNGICAYPQNGMLQVADPGAVDRLSCMLDSAAEASQRDEADVPAVIQLECDMIASGCQSVLNVFRSRFARQTLWDDRDIVGMLIRTVERIDNLMSSRPKDWTESDVCRMLWRCGAEAIPSVRVIRERLELTPDEQAAYAAAAEKLNSWFGDFPSVGAVGDYVASATDEDDDDVQDEASSDESAPSVPNATAESDVVASQVESVRCCIRSRMDRVASEPSTRYATDCVHIVPTDTGVAIAAASSAAVAIVRDDGQVDRPTVVPSASLPSNASKLKIAREGGQLSVTGDRYTTDWGAAGAVETNRRFPPVADEIQQVSHDTHVIAFLDSRRLRAMIDALDSGEHKNLRIMVPKEGDGPVCFTMGQNAGMLLQLVGEDDPISTYNGTVMAYREGAAQAD